MAGWVIWALVAVLHALGELATPGLFFLGPVALAAIPAGIVALIGGAAWLQVLVFILGSLATLAVVRPIARAHLRILDHPQFRSGDVTTDFVEHFMSEEAAAAAAAS
jgi:membrane protein implicated in regulation of membrane protease activity